MSDAEFNMHLKFFDSFIFCGQISDPILHPKLKEFLSKVHIAEKLCTVHVSASHKPEKYYIECFKANPNAKWFFGIDGLPKDSHKYRVRQNGEKLFNIMLESRKYLTLPPVWQYIIFSYNENDIEEAKALCQKHDIKLVLIKSNRWIDNDPLKPSSKEHYA
jgi:MoaA/NifB/PqqE/SkfB family radical SAM enzyme